MASSFYSQRVDNSLLQGMEALHFTVRDLSIQVFDSKQWLNAGMKLTLECFKLDDFPFI